MASLSPTTFGVIARCHGVVTTRQLNESGVSENEIRGLVRTGQLIVVRKSVFRHAAAPRTHDQQLALACAIADTVVISHKSAGRDWGFRRLGRDRRVHVTIPGRAHLHVPGAVIHRSHLILPIDIVERNDGIRLTSVERTIFDLANEVSDGALESILEQALHENLCTMQSVLASGSQLCRRGRNGSDRFRRVIDSRPEWWRPVDTDLELRLEEAVIAAALPRPIRQHAIRLPDGSDIHPDFFWPDLSIAVEVDHSFWHGGRESQAYDKWRDRQLMRMGVRTMRVTEDDIRQRLSAVMVDLGAVLHA